MVLKLSEKVPDFVFTRHRQGFRFHLAPVRNRFEITPVRVTFSHNFDPVPCERKSVLRLFSTVFNSLRTRVNLIGLKLSTFQQYEILLYIKLEIFITYIYYYLFSIVVVR